MNAKVTSLAVLALVAWACGGPSPSRAPAAMGDAGAPAATPAGSASAVASASAEDAHAEVRPFGPGLKAPVRVGSSEVPASLSKPGLSGLVVVRCNVMSTGAAEKCRVTESIAGLDEAELVREMHASRFEPAKLNGESVSVRYIFQFQIGKQPDAKPPTKKK